MTREKLLKLKDRFQAVSKWRKELNSEKNHDGLTGINLIALQDDALRALQDCLRARIELVRGKND